VSHASDELAALDLVRGRLVHVAGRRGGYVVSAQGARRLRAALVIGSVAATVTVREIGGAGAEVLLSESACRILKRAAQQVGRAELRMQLSGGGLPLRVRSLPGPRQRTEDGVRLGLHYRLTADQHVALDRLLIDLFNDRGALRVRADPDTPFQVVLRAWGTPHVWRGLVLDASLTGLGTLVSASRPLALGTPVEVGLRVDNGARVTCLRGTVVRCLAPDVTGAAHANAWQVGLRFDESEERVGAAGVGRYVVRRQLAIREHWNAASVA
jgi:hypothetical protein